MSSFYLIVSSLGGITAFIGGVALIVRAVLKNVIATRDNTRALNEVIELVEKMQTQFDDLKIRVALIEDRSRRSR